MLSVSSAWRAAVLNPLVSRRVLVMAQIDLTGSILDSGISSVTTPAADETSKPAQLTDGVMQPDYAYASLDSAWTVGDAKYVASKIYGQNGYVGAQLSGTGGTFTTQEIIAMTLTAPTRINHFTVAFDQRLNEYAVDFDIAFLNSAGTEIGRWAVTGNASTALTLVSGGSYAEMIAVKTIRLIVKKWSAAGRTCKVSECYSGAAELVTGGNRILTMIPDEEMEASASVEVGSCLASALTLTLDNSDRRYSKSNASGIIYGLDMRKKRIQIYAGLIYDDGSSEMVWLGTYFVTNWGEEDGEIPITIKAMDMMAGLDGVTYAKTSSLTYPATLFALIQDVFACAGFSVEFFLDASYASLSIPSAPNFNGASCRQVLRYAAQMVNGSILQMRNMTIRCVANLIAENASESGLFNTPVLTIGPSAYFGGLKVADNAGGPTRVRVKYGTGDSLEAMKNDATEEGKNGIQETVISGNPIAATFTSSNAQHFKNLAWSIPEIPRLLPEMGEHALARGSRAGDRGLRDDYAPGRHDQDRADVETDHQLRGRSAHHIRAEVLT